MPSWSRRRVPFFYHPNRRFLWIRNSRAAQRPIAPRVREVCRWDRKYPTYNSSLSVSGWLLLLGNRSFAGIGDIHGATGLEDFLRTIALFAALGMDGEQDVPVLDLSFVAFRLILRNTHANERTGKASGYVRL